MADGLGEIRTVDIGYEAEGHGAIAVVPQRFVGHHRTQIGAADTDVDDVGNALAGVAGPGAAAHPIGKLRHLVENCMNLRHDIAPVVHDRGPTRGAQRHVQHRALLGDVDLIAPEHGLDALAHAGLLREPDQQAEGLLGNAVLGIIKVDAGSLCHQPLAALRLLREQLAQVQARYALIMPLECAPSREARQGWGLPGVFGNGPHCALAPARGYSHLCQLAFRIAVLLPSMHDIRSFQDFTKDAAPSFCSWVASASTSMPALAKLASTDWRSPPSTASTVPGLPWSLTALRVPSGMVLTVNGAASAST